MGSKGYQFKNAQPLSRIILLSISSHPINTVGLLVLQVYSVISSGSTLRWSCSNRWHSLSNIEDRHELSHWPLLCSTRGRCSDFWWECKIMLLWFYVFILLSISSEGILNLLDLNHHPHTQSTIFLSLFFSLSIWKLNCGLKGADIGWQLCSTWRFFNGKLQLVFPSNERKTRSDETSGKKKQVFETVHHPRLFTVKKKLGKVNCANLTWNWYKRGKIGKLKVENVFLKRFLWTFFVGDTKLDISLNPLEVDMGVKGFHKIYWLYANTALVPD